MSKGKPIPTKFDKPEEDLLFEIRRRSGLTVSEIVRRAVRLLRQELAEEYPDLSLILVDLSPDVPDAGADREITLLDRPTVKLQRKPRGRAQRKKADMGDGPAAS